MRRVEKYGEKADEERCMLHRYRASIPPYLSSMRSCAKMSLPGQWMDLQMSPIISTSSHELSSSCTWSWRDSCRKPLKKHTHEVHIESTELNFFCKGVFQSKQWKERIMLWSSVGTWVLLPSNNYGCCWKSIWRDWAINVHGRCNV